MMFLGERASFPNYVELGACDCGAAASSLRFRDSRPSSGSRMRFRVPETGEVGPRVVEDDR